MVAVAQACAQVFRQAVWGKNNGPWELLEETNLGRGRVVGRTHDEDEG